MVHPAVDTGMRRLGFAPHTLKADPSVPLKFLKTHATHSVELCLIALVSEKEDPLNAKRETHTIKNIPTKSRGVRNILICSIVLNKLETAEAADCTSSFSPDARDPFVEILGLTLFTDSLPAPLGCILAVMRILRMIFQITIDITTQPIAVIIRIGM